MKTRSSSISKLLIIALTIAGIFIIGINSTQAQSIFGGNKIPDSNAITKVEVDPFLYLPFDGDWYNQMSSMMDHKCPLEGKDGEIWAYPDYATAFNPIADKKLCADNNTPPNYATSYCTDLFAPGYEFRTADGTWAWYDGHEGYDWEMPSGTDVYAAADGTVECADWAGSGNCSNYPSCYGYIVVVNHNNGYRTLYAHLTANSKNPHDDSNWPAVTPTTVIAHSGNTTGGPICGNTGPHLHFSVFHNNKYVDPFGWFEWGWNTRPDPLGECTYGESGPDLWIDRVPHRPSDPAELISDVPGNQRYVGGGITPPGGSLNDNSIFVDDLTLRDGSIVSPGQSLTKTWRMRNIGTTTWGDGYRLVFNNGERMGAPSEINVPTTSPNQDVDLSINITAPGTPGEHAGYWRLRNPQGTYFGPTIWVKINTQTAGSHITIFSADPSSPSNTDSVRFHALVENYPNFRAMRIKVDGQVMYELGATEYYWDWNTSGYNTGEHSIVVEVANQTDTTWSNSEIRSMIYTLTGTGASNNHVPDRPSLVSPYDWHVYYSGNTANLCARSNGDPDGDPVTSYYFEVTGAENWNSGWVGSSCVNTAGMGPHNYEWKVKVRDSRGGESDWSDRWHFTLVNPNLSITQLYFEPQDSFSERVKIRACTEGQGGIGITMKVRINEANDGSSNGKWNTIYELGVPCFNDNDAPIWNTLRYSDGTHRVRVEAHGLNTGWDGAAVREELFTLPHRRPAGPKLYSPIPQSLNSREAIFLNSRTIKFLWESTNRSNTYTLHIGTETNPQNDPTPIYRQTFDSSSTLAEITLNQDFPALYWQVTATNDVGNSSSNDQLIGIDRISPSCTILQLPNVTYENYYQVSWSSTDDLSGTKSVDIEFMDSDRGVWVTWLSSVPSSKTYDLFTGQAGHMYLFRCKATDRANNTGGYSENSNTIIVDPSSRPPEAWWDEAYTIKRSITILNNMADRALPTEYPVHLRFDSSTIPSSNEIYNMSLTATKCNDIRIVYNDVIELDRFSSSCSNDLIEIWFSTKTTINAGSTDNISYRLYMSNPNAINPPSDQTKIWPPLIDEYTKGLWFLSEGVGSSVTDFSGQGNFGYPGILNWIYGKFGYALASPYRSNGNNAFFVPGSASLGSSAFTLDFFAQRYDLGWGYIAGQGMSGDNRERMRLQVEGPGVIKFQIDPLVGGASDIWARSGCLSDLQWHHIAVTFDGYRTGQIFCDGILRGSGQFNDSGISNLNFNLHIGSDFSTADRFHGAIDQIRYSNTVRSSFPHADFIHTINEPTLGVGEQIEPPSTGNPDLVMLNLGYYQFEPGKILVQAVFRNQSSFDVKNGFFTDLYLNTLPVGVGDYSGSLQFWINDPMEAGETISASTIIQDTDLISRLMDRALSPGDEVTGILYAQVDSSGSVTETDDQNNISSSGTPICVASPDGFEDDNDVETASIIHLWDTQRHNFDKPNGQDWVRFDAQAGVTYTLKTYNLGAASDTYMYLYDTDGTTLLGSNDDFGGSLASQIQWQAPTTGTYYILIRHWNPNAGGCGTGYTFTIQIGSRLFLPSINTK